MTYAMQVHQTDEGRLLAACDGDLVGEEFHEGDRQLIVEAGFYGEDDRELLDILDALEDVATANFVGERLIGELVDAEIVSEDEIDRIDGIPHVQLYFM